MQKKLLLLLSFISTSYLLADEPIVVDGGVNASVAQPRTEKYEEAAENERGEVQLTRRSLIVRAFRAGLSNDYAPSVTQEFKSSVEALFAQEYEEKTGEAFDPEANPFLSAFQQDGVQYLLHQCDAAYSAGSKALSQSGASTIIGESGAKHLPGELGGVVFDAFVQAGEDVEALKDAQQQLAAGAERALLEVYDEKSGRLGLGRRDRWYGGSVVKSIWGEKYDNPFAFKSPEEGQKLVAERQAAALAHQQAKEKEREEARIAAEQEKARKAEKARIAAGQEKARQEVARKAQEEQDRQAAQIAAQKEKERKAEEARIAAKQEAARKAQEEQDRQAAQIAAQKEKERKAEEARIAAKQEAARKAQEEQDRLESIPFWGLVYKGKRKAGEAVDAAKEAAEELKGKAGEVLEDLDRRADEFFEEAEEKAKKFKKEQDDKAYNPGEDGWQF